MYPSQPPQPSISDGCAAGQAQTLQAPAASCDTTSQEPQRFVSHILAGPQIQAAELRASLLTGKLPQSSISDVLAPMKVQALHLGAAATLRPQQPPKSLVSQVVATF
mmetsp:Transcript_14665/g.34610  ORF Transcript_14665/g.34610 Transcript_14665/m.34610 type:complete len:107 (+) Transcript_14665:112-432(+)